MKCAPISMIALFASPLVVFAFSCLAPAENVSETQQGLQMCSSTCSAWGGNPVSCTSSNGDCVADANGVTCDGGTAQQQSIACSCANLSVTVTTNPVGQAMNQTVTWTAHPSGGSGNYSYTWVETWCFNGNAPGDCNGSSNTVTNASPTRSVFSSRFSVWDQYCVRIHDNTCSAFGDSMSACARVDGQGLCQGTRCQQ